ncbi:MAG: metalloregulator ArsR/SmtB family transcription factor [Pelolinea sp.]|nr:metalloregulator ArsR/SmtB family transcription factor [Pelolinea sp.]
MKKNTKSLELEINLLHERICSALADTTRIMILYLLAEKDMFVNDISEALDTPQSTISRHLRVLRERNLVATERQGTAVLYSLPDDRIIQVLDLMRAILNDQIQAEAAITKSI